MPRMTYTPNRVTVNLSIGERIAAVRGDIHLDPATIAEAEVVDSGLATVRGVRAPGLGLPGYAKIGTWRHRGAVTVAIVQGRGSALHLRTSAGPVRDVLVTTDDPHADLAAIRAVMPGGAA